MREVVVHTAGDVRFGISTTHPRRHRRSAARGADPLAAGRLRCARHRLVRRRATKVLLHP